MRRLQLSGYPALVVGGVALSGPITQRHRLALLALLALSPNRALAREKIFAMLWPEADIASARHLLNTAVHVIRRDAGDDVLLTRRDEVALAPDVEVDVLQFDTMRASGQHELALSLHRASFLDGFFLDGSSEFEQWLSRERSRLVVAYRESLEALAERCEREGDSAAALQWWRRLNHEDPYNTRVVVRLMLALEQLGDHGNAIDIADEHAALLARELEAEPSTEFRQLVARIRDRPDGSRLPVQNGTARARSFGEVTGRAGPAAHRSTLGGVVVVAMVTIGGIVMLAPWRDAPATRVVIREFENRSGDTTLTRIGAGVHAALMRAASAWSLLEVLLPAAPDPEGIRLTAGPNRLRAGTVIDGSYSVVADSVRVEARVVRAKSGRLLRGLRAAWPVNSSSTAPTAEFVSRVLGAVGMSLDDRLSAVTTAEHSPPTFEAYREFMAGFQLHGNADHAKAIDHFRRAIASDSTFSLADVWLLRALDKSALFREADSVATALEARSSSLPEADRYAVNMMRARYRGDTQSAFRNGKALSALTPGSPWLLSYASDAANLRRAAESHQVLVELERRSPWIGEWSEFVANLGAALHLLGRFSEEHTLARRKRHEATNLIVRLIAEAQPLAAMGRVADIDLLVHEALATAEQPNLNEGSLMQRIGLELRAHGHADAATAMFVRSRSWYEAQLREGPRTPMFAWALGNTLLNLDELDSARNVFRALHQRLPGMYRFQGDLAVVAARTAQRAEYAHFDSLLAQQDNAWNVFDSAIRVLYRARTAALLGNRERALELLQDAVAQGVPEPLDSVHINPDLHSLRGLPGFDELTRLRR